jgi:hypothetical protein
MTSRRWCSVHSDARAALGVESFGMQVLDLDLTRSITHGWKLRTVRRGEPVMQMRGRAASLRVEIFASFTRLTDAHVAVLVACAIPLVEDYFTPVIPPAG